MLFCSWCIGGQVCATIPSFWQAMTEIYLEFYLCVLQIFVNFNHLLQRDDPLIPILFPQLDSFLNELAGRFIWVSAIKEADSMKELDYTNLQCQLSGMLNMTIMLCLFCLSSCFLYYLFGRWWPFYWNEHQVPSPMLLGRWLYYWVSSDSVS